jgi:hypothetical protein
VAEVVDDVALLEDLDHPVVLDPLQLAVGLLHLGVPLDEVIHQIGVVMRRNLKLRLHHAETVSHLFFLLDQY